MVIQAYCVKYSKSIIENRDKKGPKRHAYFCQHCSQFSLEVRLYTRGRFKGIQPRWQIFREETNLEHGDRDGNGLLVPCIGKYTPSKVTSNRTSYFHLQCRFIQPMYTNTYAFVYIYTLCI